MTKTFTLEYWIDEGWYVGRLLEVPGVFSQGETLEELIVNIREAYKLMVEEVEPVYIETKRKEIEVEVSKEKNLFRS
ncbi:MAG TPA: type II toxin-antitoxin system HicB family antitoxin [Spirochaetota bacterium]|nr:type II toxin-antitoxin system HicB family antitoxin [Spirochaetota bacterium]HOM09913.1 type II toxin-antitoxin system HicB family antitoxin [Spirochaetota bacterium]HPP48648.1 type II toxin-antitoxin system HicB family antitoxin [Spirochaetota bacterium]HXK65194.1 type II toxin-antitoxin system HicB family antitoxin [Spirochaetota bacterium]